MKTSILLFVGFLLFLAVGNAGSQDIQSKTTGPQNGTISILCTPDLYELTSELAARYSIMNPGVKISVVNTDYGNAGLGEDESLGFISNRAKTAVNNSSNWKMTIGHDVIVPVMNAGNPYLKDIVRQGLSQAQLSLMFKNPESRNWGTILAGTVKSPVHLYMVNDEGVQNGLAGFLKETQLPGAGITVGSSDEIVRAIQNDPLAIGFCNVTDIQNENTIGLAENLQFLPIDKNGNGTIDYMEDIYADMNEFQRGVWIGKYPKSLVSNIYAVSSVQPSQEKELSFLKWVLADGQQYMKSFGYSDLASAESQSHLDKLTPASIIVSPVKNASQTGTILLVIAVVLMCGLVVSAMMRNYRKQKEITPDFSDMPVAFNEESVVLPKGLYFDKTHTWAFMEKNGFVTIGIDDFLRHITGPITRVEMKNTGDKIKKGEVLFTIIQYGKQLNIYAPFSGTIKMQNEALLTDSSVINTSPYELGWIYRMEPVNWIKDMQLMDLSDKYRRWLDAEFSRMKDFLAAVLKPESNQYAHVVLQDGGELKEGVLSDFGPEVWEDFQSNFLDSYK